MSPADQIPNLRPSVEAVTRLLPMFNEKNFANYGVQLLKDSAIHLLLGKTD